MTKQRPQLPERYQAIYDEQVYKDNRTGKGIASSAAIFMESWMHRKVASTRFHGNRVLEIGAGTLNQMNYELNAAPVYDVVEPLASLYDDSPYKDKVSSFYTDISQISGKQYDRIISIAAFEHILNLEEVMQSVKRLIKKDGIHCVAIPNEGHFLWKLGYTMTTGIAFRLKYGLDYSVIMRYEHVNNADEIEILLKKYHRTVKCSFFGLGRHLSLYRVYFCND